MRVREVPELCTFFLVTEKAFTNATFFVSNLVELLLLFFLLGPDIDGWMYWYY